MIEVQGLGFRYGKTWIFRDVSLLKPATGSATLGGRLGYVAQRTEIAFSYKVIDIVVMGRAALVGMFQAPGSIDYEHARNALARLHLEHLAEKQFNLLSGGERQLVMIARALASECQVLILDEPASALDFRNQDLVLATLRVLAKDLDLSILMTTHFPQHAAHIADYSLLLQSVDESQWGLSEEMLSEEKLELFELKCRGICSQNWCVCIRVVDVYPET